VDQPDILPIPAHCVQKPGFARELSSVRGAPNGPVSILAKETEPACRANFSPTPAPRFAPEDPALKRQI